MKRFGGDFWKIRETESDRQNRRNRWRIEGVIAYTKCDGRTDGRTDAQTDRQTPAKPISPASRLRRQREIQNWTHHITCSLIQGHYSFPQPTTGKYMSLEPFDRSCREHSIKSSYEHCKPPIGHILPSCSDYLRLHSDQFRQFKSADTAVQSYAGLRVLMLCYYI
jgi:hypothetical protein